MINVLDYSCVGDGKTDNTSTLQKIFDTFAGYIIFFPPGIYAVYDSLFIGSNTRLQGSGTPPWDNKTTTGSRIYGYGSSTTSNALIYSKNTTTVTNLYFNNLLIETDTASTYSWVMQLYAMNSSYVNGCVFRNQYANGGGVYFDTNTENGTRWINNIFENVFSPGSNGFSVQSMLTDSRFIGNYCSGGRGAVENGYNNLWSSNMFDLSSGDALQIAPTISANAPNSPLFTTINNCNFQASTVTGISFFVSGPQQTYQCVVNGCNFNGFSQNNVQTPQHIFISNAIYISITGCSFDTSATYNVKVQNSKNILISSNITPKGVYLAGDTSNILQANNLT
jgi:hypothetical protein